MNIDVRNHVIYLLDTYHKRARQIAVLRYELTNPAMVTDSEVLEAMQFARSEGIRRPAGHISNKTLHIALNYREQAKRINAENLDEISTELVKLTEEQSRLEYFVSLLEPRQEKILRLTCFERVPQEAVAKELGITVRRVQAIKAQAIDELAEMYELAGNLK